MSATSMPSAVVNPVTDDFFPSDEKLDKNKKELMNFWKLVHQKSQLFFSISDVCYIFYSARVVGDEKAPARVIPERELCEKSKKILLKFLTTPQVCDGKKGNWSNGTFGSRWCDIDVRKEGLTVRVAFHKRDERERRIKGNEKPYNLIFTWEELPYCRCGNPACQVYSNTMKKCSVCERRRYCSNECQKAHWKEHKQVCKPVEKEEEEDE